MRCNAKIDVKSSPCDESCRLTWLKRICGYSAPRPLPARPLGCARARRRARAIKPRMTIGDRRQPFDRRGDPNNFRATAAPPFSLQERRHTCSRRTLLPWRGPRIKVACRRARSSCDIASAITSGFRIRDKQFDKTTPLFYANCGDSAFLKPVRVARDWLGAVLHLLTLLLMNAFVRTVSFPQQRPAWNMSQCR